MKINKSIAAGLATAMIAAAGSAQAAAVTYFKTQGDANGAVTGTPVTAAADFAATLAPFATTETFESKAAVALPTSAYSIQGGTIAPVLAAGWKGKIQNARTDISGAFPGRFNTSPGTVTGDGHWMEATSSFSISLTTASTAFGMYMTDLGDFRGTLDVDFCTDSSSCVNYAFTNLAMVTGIVGNGALSFLGYTNDTTSFNRVVVNIHQAPGIPLLQQDWVGFDGLTVGNVKGASLTTPEPTSLALTGLALALAGHLARRRRA